MPAIAFKMYILVMCILTSSILYFSDMKPKADLLLLHGALGSQAQFESLKKDLAPYFRVHVFNFSGHGGNPTDQNFLWMCF